MKKIIILSLLFAIGYAQKKNVKPLDQAQQLKKSKDTTALLLADIKRLATQKIVYRTKVIEVHDTAWRIDTCIAVITPVDSATIAIIFQNREIQKKTGVGKVIYYISHKRKKVPEK